MITQQMEEYLEAIGKLAERGEAVTTSALARECHVAPPTVTEMLRRLAAQGLIDYEPRREITLTAEGKEVAQKVIRRHRLWERFLHDVLGFKWHEVHEQACSLEHATSPELESRLAQAVGPHNTCPHGFAIPGEETTERHNNTLSPLADLTLEQSMRVVSVGPESGDRLRHLEEHGIRPGAIVHATETSTPQEPLCLTVDGEPQSVERELAQGVLTTPLSEAKAAEGDKGAIPLSSLRQGETGTLLHFAAGRGMVTRCLALGLTPGARLRVVQHLHRGPVIVLVRDTRIALGFCEAQRIMVKRERADGQDTLQPAGSESLHNG